MTPAHLSCPEAVLQRSPISRTRQFAVALVARGRQPSAGDARWVGVAQLPEVYSHWGVKEGKEVPGLKQWDLFVFATCPAPARSAAVE
eukprot:9018461-Lingulodinium_polyedra.AAC.1